jgi:hypothetical protein
MAATVLGVLRHPMTSAVVIPLLIILISAVAQQVIRSEPSTLHNLLLSARLPH